MSNKILTLAVLSAISLTLLSACMTAGDINIAPSENPNLANNLNSQSSTDKSESMFLPDPSVALAGRVISYHAGGTLENETVDITVREAQNTFSVQANTNDDTLIMKVNDVDYVISPNADSSDNAYRSDSNIFLELIGTDANLRDVIEGTDTDIKGGVAFYSTDINDYDSSILDIEYAIDYTSGFATVGIQTPAHVVASQTSIATYNGTMDFSVLQVIGDFNYKINQLPGNGYDRGLDSGISIVSFTTGSNSYTLTMNVNFEDNIVSGTATNSQLSDKSNQITFDSAPIVGNGFAGTFTLDTITSTDVSIADNLTGNYAGNFFGDNAEDLAGVMRLKNAGVMRVKSTDALNPPALGWGGFRADRQ